MKSITLDDVIRFMAEGDPLYSWRTPRYQFAALESLQRLWNPAHLSALDVGGGTGLIAHAVKQLFGLRRIASVDIEDRFRPSLGIETAVYDGATLPFADGSFDCVLLFNVIHHVPVNSRIELLRECRRVAGDGPIYIKDHVSRNSTDDVRLTILDVLGNVPFHGMVRASYLRENDWRALASATGHIVSERASGAYRTRPFEILFPNRLEVSMRWTSA